MEVDEDNNEPNPAYKDLTDPIENYEPVTRQKFGIPNEEEDHTLSLFIGPTRGGKSYQIKKLLVDVWLCPNGRAPFEKIYYIGQEKSFQEMRTAFAAMEYAYTGQKDNFKTEVKLYTCTQVQDALNDIAAADKKIKKFAIFDDCYTINSTNKLRERMVNVFQQGQHHSLTSWVVVHQSTEKNGVTLRKPANYIFFCNEPPQTVALITQCAPDSEPIKQYEVSAKSNDNHRFLIFDQSSYAFYDNNYLKI
jgi:hypothetical protein